MQDNRFIKREQLYQKLKDNCKNIILLQAGAGFGKTTVIKQFLKQQQTQSLFISLHEADNNKTLFLQKMSSCISPMNEETQCDSYYYHVFSWIRNIRIEKKCKYIVFDNVENIYEKEVTGLMENMLENRSNHCVFIFISRIAPGFLARYRMNGQCFVLEGQEFFFSRNETKNLVNLIIGKDKNKGNRITEILMTIFWGWPAGIDNFLEQFRYKILPQGKYAWYLAITNTYIIEYICEQVLFKTEKKWLDFLIQTATISCVDPYICTKVFGIVDSDLILKELSKICFFIEKKKDGYVCMGVFRAVLMMITGTEKLKQIITSVMEYYLKEKEYQLASEYASQIMQTDAIIFTLEKYGDELFKHGQMRYCVRVLLFLFQRKCFYSTRILCLFASIFRQRQKQGLDRKKEDGEERLLKLLHYNDEPAKYAEEFVVYLQQAVGTYEKKEGVCVTVFGSFHVVIEKNNKELSFRTKKGCELFAFLLHMNGKPVERHVLLNTLWPQEIPKNAVVMLHNMIYNIRKKMEPYHMEDIIIYKNKSYQVNTKYIHMNEDNVFDICTYVEQNDCENVVERESVFEQYWGRYLESLDAEWIGSNQQYYDKIYKKGLFILADYYMNQKRYEKAIFYLESSLEQDNLQEDVVILLVYCYAEIKKIKEIKELYDRFKEVLKKELGIEPCKQLRELYEKSLNNILNMNEKKDYVYKYDYKNVL